MTTNLFFVGMLLGPSGQFRAIDGVGGGTDEVHLAGLLSRVPVRYEKDYP